MQLPRNFDARIFFYCADLISAPQTWDEAATKRLNTNAMAFTALPFPENFRKLWHLFYELLGMAAVTCLMHSSTRSSIAKPVNGH